MSGFSSLLSQFKQTTQQAASTIGAADKLGEASDTKKRSRSIFEASNSNSTHQNVTSQSKLPKHQQYVYPTTPVQTIYIACPAYAETGGPEALHQLCHMINTGEYSYANDDDGDQTAAVNMKNNELTDASSTQYDEFGRAIATKCNKDDVGTTDTTNCTEHAEARKKKNVVKAYMLYLRERSNGLEHIQTTRARSSKYDRYDAPLATTLPLSSSTQDFVIDRGGSTSINEYTSDLVIWPECWTHLIDSLQQPITEDGQSNNQGKKYQIAIWWLSVNNNKGRFLPHQFSLRCDILHLVQSTYAKEYVSSKLLLGRKSSSTMSGKSEEKDEEKEDRVLNVMNMTEFISYASPTFSPKPKINADKEEDVERDLDVVYNTAKGMHYTDEIIKRACGKKAKTNPDGSVVGGGLKFNPIGKGVGGRERMTEEEVVALLKRSKVVRIILSLLYVSVFRWLSHSLYTTFIISLVYRFWTTPGNG